VITAVFFLFIALYYDLKFELKKKKQKQSLYRPGQALRVAGG